jgi:NADH-quinone oxidoreductase subunit L
MNALLFLSLIPLLPLAGFLLNGLLGRRLPRLLVTLIALFAPLVSFLIVARVALLTWKGLVALPVAEGLAYNHETLDWINLGTLHIDFSFALDQLTLVMLLVVTGVGFLIHIYSVGYMHDDPGYARYFSYLNLFLFFMTTLVLAGNVLVMFVGWEGVGLASYLLIGFWFNKPSAASAGMKAFVVNRIGDFGFLIGIFLLLANFGTLTFSEIAAKLAASPAWTGGILTVTCLCLLIGATGKSAQLPLYIWLPDAMEGPTPVSALIHAATMVTAGVYMIARFHFLFDRSPFALSVVAIVGAATALFAATMGLAQNDIKRVLAYSTISQLGYMFLGCGVAAYSAAIFHLMTHAFFKALLFLAAGSVIHALGGEQDLRKMGGLRKKIPITFWTMTAAVLAISGFPGFSGFFSKDAILASAFAQGTFGTVLCGVGVLTAGITALYMFRLWYMAFLGESRDPHAHPHESPWSMLVPLVLLAILSIGGGWVALGDRFYNFLAPITGPRAELRAGTLEYILMGIAVFVGFIGWLIAHLHFKPGSLHVAPETAAPTGLTKILVNKYYVDEIYNAVFVRPLLVISRYILGWVVDGAILGGAVWLLGGLAIFGGAVLQRWQSGNLRSYAAWLAAGAAVLLLFVLLASSPHTWSLPLFHGHAIYKAGEYTVTNLHPAGR